MNVLRKYKLLLVSILLPMILIGAYNVVAYGHQHILDTGEIIYHSHPFKSTNTNNTPFEKHNHSQSELIILHQLTNLLTSALIVFTIFSILLKQNYINKTVLYIRFYKSSFVNSLNYRGPPVFC